MRMRLGTAVMALAMVTGGLSRIEAAAISYTSLTAEVLVSDTIGADSLGVPDDWDFYSFTPTKSQLYKITVRREESDLDPIFAVWEGTELDTSDYEEMFDDTLTTPFSLLGVADDTLPPAVPGPFGDPQLIVFLNAGQTYAIAVAEHDSDASTGSLAYNIVVNAVPEPTSLTLAGVALAGVVLGASRRRRV